MKKETELEKNQRGTDHDPSRGVRKVVYDCFDHRIVNDADPNTPLYVIINQHGFLGYVTEHRSDKFVGYINEATIQAFSVKEPSIVVSDSFEDCIKRLTDMHVDIFHQKYLNLIEESNSKEERP